MRTRCILTLAVILLSLQVPARSCTTAIVSGKVTPDGRPLLFKHRDTGHRQNCLMVFDDGKYEYVGLVNASDSTGNEVWAGFNSAGFAIMNSESYNLNSGDTISLRDREGIVMKQALQRCATLEDFEQLLRDLPKPLGVRANFGCIDARGGAAYYETGHFDFTKFDVNDRRLAPDGYMIRTNFSFDGTRDDGYGYIRYQNAAHLLDQAAATGQLDYRFLLQKVSRSLHHALLGTDLTENPPDTGNPVFSFFEDFIPRYSSAAVTLIQGLASGQDPQETLMWTIPGFPLCAVAVPVWLTGSGDLPELTVRNAEGVAPLCDMALDLKGRCFPISRGSGYRYIDRAFIYNREETGILQKLLPFEQSIFTQTENLLKDAPESGLTDEQIRDHYSRLDRTISEWYRQEFGLDR